MSRAPLKTLVHSLIFNDNIPSRKTALALADSHQRPHIIYNNLVWLGSVCLSAYNYMWIGSFFGLLLYCRPFPIRDSFMASRTFKDRGREREHESLVPLADGKNHVTGTLTRPITRAKRTRGAKERKRQDFFIALL